MRKWLAFVLAAVGSLSTMGGCGDDPAAPTAVEPVPVVRQLTATPGFEGNPVFSPDGQWVLYEADAAGNMDIYRIPTAGGDPDQLTSDPAFDSSASWSADGATIVFESVRSGYKNLWLLLLDTPGSQPVPLTAGEWDDGSPMFSPNGDWVVFESNRAKTVGSDLWIVSAGGGEVVALTTTRDGIYNRTADWAPDSQSLVYESNRTGWSAIYTQPRVGGEAIRLTSEENYEGHPAWSPDGAWIAYESDASGTMEVHLIPATGGKSHQLTAYGGYWPRFSADGAYMVFGVFEGENSDIWVMEVDW